MCQEYSDKSLVRVNPEYRAEGAVVTETSRRSERKIIHRIAGQAPAEPSDMPAFG